MKIRFGLKAFVSALLVSGFLLAASSASAALIPPNLVQGFPMLAGPQVMVMWLPVPGAVNYKVYRNGEVVATQPLTQFMEPSAGLKGELRYEVAGVDAAGVEGPKSRPGTLKIVVLVPPKNLTGMIVGDEARVRWDTVEGASIYNVYKGDKAEGPFNMLTSVTANSYTDPELKEGNTAWYQVTAKDLAGKESKPSDTYMMERKVAVAVASAAVETFYKRTQVVWSVYNDMFDPEDNIISLRSPTDVEVDRDNKLIYVSTKGGNRICVLRYDGLDTDETSYLLAGYIGPNGYSMNEAEVGTFRDIGGIALTDDNAILAISSGGDNKVHVFDLANQAFLAEFEVSVLNKDIQPGQRKYRIYDIEFDSEDRIWVPDSMNNTLHVFDYAGEYLGNVGSGGEGGLSGPAFFSVDSENQQLIIANGRASSLVIMDFEGNLVSKWGDKGVGPGKFWAPAGTQHAADGTIFHADGINPYVSIFDREGKLLFHLKNHDDDIVQVAGTRGISLIDENHLLVTLSINDELKILRIQPDLYEDKPH